MEPWRELGDEELWSYLRLLGDKSVEEVLTVVPETDRDLFKIQISINDPSKGWTIPREGVKFLSPTGADALHAWLYRTYRVWGPIVGDKASVAHCLNDYQDGVITRGGLIGQLLLCIPTLSVERTLLDLPPEWHKNFRDALWSINRWSYIFTSNGRYNYPLETVSAIEAWQFS